MQAISETTDTAALICSHTQIHSDPNVWVCSVCKHVANSTSAPRNRKCGKPVPQMPKVPASKPVGQISQKMQAHKHVPIASLPVIEAPCIHKGGFLREQGCKPCQAAGKGAVSVFGCAVHGECTESNTGIIPRIQACLTCGQKQRKPFEIVPSKGGALAWRGISEPKPWEYSVTAIVPVVQPDETVPLMIDLLRLQTEKPYILLIDTGSDEATCKRLETMRASDLEVHFIRKHGNIHLAECVSQACDLGAALALTRFTFFTHSDCFLTSRTAIAKAKEIAERHIVAGHQISQRRYEGWEREVGHTFLMCDQDELDRRGITWKMRRGIVGGQIVSPGTTDYTSELLPPHVVDTERGFNKLLQQHGITPFFTGSEQNYQRNTDDLIDHVRSWAAAGLYSEQYAAEASQWMPNVIRDAEERRTQWQKEAASIG